MVLIFGAFVVVGGCLFFFLFTMEVAAWSQSCGGNLFGCHFGQCMSKYL